MGVLATVLYMTTAPLKGNTFVMFALGLVLFVITFIVLGLARLMLRASAVKS